MSTEKTEPSQDAVIDISIAHSPDSDDAFMFYGLATNKIRVPGYRFSHTLCDIETLNKRAREEAFYDVSAISFHAYPYVQESYTLMGCGGSVGEGYGPMIVSSRKLELSDLNSIKIAVPGELTTAFLALKIFNPDLKTETVPFDKIIPAIQSGTYEAGLIIHERPEQDSGSRRVVAGDDGPGASAGRKRDSPLAGRGEAQDHFEGAARQHSARTGSSRAGAGVCNAVCARAGCAHGKPLCEHVCERTDAGLRCRRA